jgi:hypothetical protein
LDLKTFLTRNKNVSGQYGDDLVIVKSDCLNHGSVLLGCHRSETLDPYGASPCVPLCLDIEELSAGSRTDRQQPLAVLR